MAFVLPVAFLLDSIDTGLLRAFHMPDYFVSLREG